MIEIGESGPAQRAYISPAGGTRLGSPRRCRLRPVLRQENGKVGVWSIFRPTRLNFAALHRGRKHGSDPFALDFAVLLSPEAPDWTVRPMAGLK